MVLRIAGQRFDWRICHRMAETATDRVLCDLKLILSEEVTFSVVEQPFIGKVDTPLTAVSRCWCVGIGINPDVRLDDRFAMYIDDVKGCIRAPCTHR